MTSVDQATNSVDTPPVGIAFVRTAVAPLNHEPRISSQQTSQQLAGHPVHVLEERDAWLRVRGLDHYEGWIHRGYLLTREAHGVVFPASAHGELTAAGVPRVSLGARVRRARGGRRDLPLGAWLDADEEVEVGEAVPRDQLPLRFPRAPGAIVESALRFFEGTRYEWGGVTPWGADCSGFVQRVFALHGVPLPRDAWQQALEGEDAGHDPVALAPADLLFFSSRADGRITHVGVALGGGRMVHVGLGRGGFAIERLDDVSDPYVAELRANFRATRRVM